MGERETRPPSVVFPLPLPFRIPGAGIGSALRAREVLLPEALDPSQVALRVDAWAERARVHSSRPGEGSRKSAPVPEDPFGPCQRASSAEDLRLSSPQMHPAPTAQYAGLCNLQIPPNAFHFRQEKKLQ